jgi:hypothetical protein
VAETVQRPPSGLGRSGRRLWRAVLSAYVLEEHERALLLECCRTADLLDRLQTVLDADGPMAESSQGIRVHPAAVELRQQRVTFARLVAALGMPAGAEDEATPQGAPRGVYRLRSVSL